MEPPVENKSFWKIIVLTKNILDIAMEGGMSLEKAKEIRGDIWRSIQELNEDRLNQLIKDKILSIPLSG